MAFKWYVKELSIIEIQKLIQVFNEQVGLRASVGGLQLGCGHWGSNPEPFSLLQIVK
jgi:hypothetical protein